VRGRGEARIGTRRRSWRDLTPTASRQEEKRTNEEQVGGYEILGTILLALGRWTTWLCLGFCAIYAADLVLVHWPAGWFVVGLGRNGMEYSVLLIACLALLAFVHAPAPRG